MNKPLSLALYLPSMEGGGVERVSLNLCGMFLRQGIDVTFVLNEARGALLDQIPPAARVVDLGATRTLRALPKLAAYLQREKPDVLLSGLGHNNIAALWARRLVNVNTAVIISQHNSLSDETRGMGGWQHRVLPLLYRFFCRLADGIVAVSSGVADDMARMSAIPRERISVIYNPIVTADFDSRRNEAMSHRWLDDPATPTFVGVGRLVAQKNFGLLIRAFSLLAPRSNARLVILGDGPQREALQSHARELGLADRIEFAGFQRNPLPFLKRATALVLSSRYEGFGNVLVEALACNTPVISTDCPHGPAEILENGRFGTLVPVDDAPRMAEAMTAVLDGGVQPAGTLRQRAHAFSTEKIGQQYIALFRDVVKNAGLCFS